jgi:tRNA-2-methylthio-N6-dimethylallyladenosine synthase
MKRLYTVDEYRTKIEQARNTVPDMSLSTDIIAGFCGETDEEFAGTEKLMRDIEFDVVHLAAYSVRPGTAAARREDDVPLTEKKRRLNHLLDLQREVATRRNLDWVGREVEVLVEGGSEDGRSYGRNRQGRLCWMQGTLEAGTIASGKVHSSTAWQLDVEVAV